jgi:hypothetical protein
MHTANPPSAAPPIPLVVQIGFVGSRRLLDAASAPEVAAFEAALLPILRARLQCLSADLRLDHGRHPLCGLSSLAVGGDLLFASVCRELAWPHRVFLPQLREDFLAATGSGGVRDFTHAEADIVRKALAATNVIQERVASESLDRRERFEDVNLELIRACDVLVVLVRAGADGKPGGSLDAIAQARACGRTVLELRVSADAAGQPQLADVWHHRSAFTPPVLPQELAALRTELTGLPPVADYCTALKRFTSHTSKQRQRFFKTAALWVVGTHAAATLCAVTALKLGSAWGVAAVLSIELALLAGGFLLHEALHGSALIHALQRWPLLGRLHGLSHAVQVWAMSRLVSECARSTLALQHVPAPLRHFDHLPLPASLRPVLRTLNVLHLRATRGLASTPWTDHRRDYLQNRVFRRQAKDDPGQVRYYLRELRKAGLQVKQARVAFLAGSLGAFAATAIKLSVAPTGAVSALLGGAAILLPVLAVAAMSLAAATDLEARDHTFREMLEFLRAQRHRLRRSPAPNAFRHLALETEAHLLGETAAWHARRAFTGIA